MTAGPSQREPSRPRPADPPPVRDRDVVVRPLPPSRRLMSAAVGAGRRLMPMHGLFDVDVTIARRSIAALVRRARDLGYGRPGHGTRRQTAAVNLWRTGSPRPRYSPESGSRQSDRSRACTGRNAHTAAAGAVLACSSSVVRAGTLSWPSLSCGAVNDGLCRSAPPEPARVAESACTFAHRHVRKSAPAFHERTWVEAVPRSAPEGLSARPQEGVSALRPDRRPS